MYMGWGKNTSRKKRPRGISHYSRGEKKGVWAVACYRGHETKRPKFLKYLIKAQTRGLREVDHLLTSSRKGKSKGVGGGSPSSVYVGKVWGERIDKLDERSVNGGGLHEYIRLGT